MSDRIFSFAELPACCTFLGPDGATHRAAVTRLHRSKAVVDTTIELEADSKLAITLEIIGAPPIALATRVFAAGAYGLFLRLVHADLKAALRFSTLLAEKALAFAPPPSHRDGARPRAGKPVVVAPEPNGGEAPPRDDVAGSPPPEGPPNVLAAVESASASSAESAAEADPMRANILSRTRRVRSADLAARHRDVQVVSMVSIQRLIVEAAEEALGRSNRQWEEGERARLLRETAADFNDRLAALKAEKAGLAEHTQHLEQQLARAQALLEDERRRVVSAERFTVSDAGIVELEQRLERLVRRVVRGEGKAHELEEEMRAAVSRLLDDEREKIRARVADAQGEELQLLESKVQRLAATLEETRAARDEAQRRAQALEQAGGAGIQNILKAGLKADDPRRGQKLGLLKELMTSNREVRAQIAARAGGDTPAARSNAPARLVATK